MFQCCFSRVKTVEGAPENIIKCPRVTHAGPGPTPLTSDTSSGAVLVRPGGCTTGRPGASDFCGSQSGSSQTGLRTLVVVCPGGEKMGHGTILVGPDPFVANYVCLYSPSPTRDFGPKIGSGSSKTLVHDTTTGHGKDKVTP